MMKQYRNNLLTVSALCAATLSSATAMAENNTKAQAASTLKDGTYVTISGKVEKVVDGDEFQLSYGNGTIMVDTNDHWPALFRKDVANILTPGDHVQVSGFVDDNLFTKKEIDAESIVHESTQYSRVYRLNDGRDNVYRPYSYYHAMDDEGISLTGDISKIIDDDSFMLNYGNGMIRVDADEIEFPKTERLRVGDRVTVKGEIDDNWFGKRTLEAESMYRINYYSPLASIR